jgi:hypothetical protein
MPRFAHSIPQAEWEGPPVIEVVQQKVSTTSPVTVDFCPPNRWFNTFGTATRETKTPAIAMHAIHTIAMEAHRIKSLAIERRRFPSVVTMLHSGRARNDP